jgi:anhydro-N-acetylmuramic acid kinase
MSGTSLDGIDVAVVDIHRGRFKVVAHQTTPYKRALRERILAVSNTNTHTAEIARLHFLLAELYADAVKHCGVPRDSIELVGCHGQTIFHEGTSTLQIGDGSVLAERLGVPVVSDFRTRDIAAGGQGAPLVPFVDYRLYASRRVHRVSLNLGGIGNITVIPAAARPDDVIAFDTGPGNMVMDQLVTIHTGGKQSFDRGGKVAAKGAVHRDIVDRLMRDPFYRAKPPKSAGREQYGREFVAALMALKLPMEDLIATATAFTARTVAEGIRRFAPHTVELVVSGGGVRNPVLMRFLGQELPSVRVVPSSEFGIDPDAKEAIAFAIMAYETWHKRPSNLPSATGARHPVILGKVSY